MSMSNQPCPNCGARVIVRYGPDYRFNPPCTKPMMWHSECSADCLAPSWTAFTSERALEMWNEGIEKAQKESGR